jgi:hypothetical protein
MTAMGVQITATDGRVGDLHQNLGTLGGLPLSGTGFKGFAWSMEEHKLSGIGG